MKILVYPHHLGLGGSQLNAIELAAAVKELGHEVLLFGQPGPLTRKAAGLGLEYVQAPVPGKRPSPRVVRALATTVRERGIDVLHGYEWPPALECLAAAKLVRGTTAVATVMSMAVAPFIPKSMPLMVGTEQIRAVEAMGGRTRVKLMEPPVDVAANSPTADVDVAGFRSRWAPGEGMLNVVCVSRLAHELKLEGLLAAMDAVEVLAREWPIRLLIIGSGPAEDVVRTRAASVNRGTGRSTVVLTGELTDPRPAYAAADVVLGMGGSALRGMSFAKPLVVQGELGFWELLTEDSLPRFLWQGWYGSGPGTAGQGSGALASLLARLLDDGALRQHLGDLGRALVEERFSLSAAARDQLRFYGEAFAGGAATGTLGAEAAALARYAAYVAGRRWQRLHGRAAAEDFNSRPVASAASGSPVPEGAKP